MPGKYFDKIRLYDKDLPLTAEVPPFDVQRLGRKSGVLGKAVGWLIEHPDGWLSFLRRFLPRVSFRNFTIITRCDDVCEVLDRQADFETAYGMEMKAMAGGEADFILGLKDSQEYERQKKAVMAAFPPHEIDSRVRDMARKHSVEIVQTAGAEFDAAGSLMRIVPVRICREYYGLKIEDDRLFGDWALALSCLFFADPTGDRTTRELAVSAARSMLATIERSLDAQLALQTPDDNPLGRLAAMHQAGNLSRDEINAIMMGMITGFMPTNLLGGINCLDVVLTRPEIFEYIDEAIRDGDNLKLGKGIIEAMRFKPIWIWPWRFAHSEQIIGADRGKPYRIKKDSLVLAATRSAMFDERSIKAPWDFDPDRDPAENFVFGYGLHACIGRELVKVQVGEAFRALFERPGFQRKPGKAGRLTRLGPFPDKLMVEFDVPVQNRLSEQTMVTICVPALPGIKTDDVRELLNVLGNPAAPQLRTALDRTGIIHFASLTAIPTGNDADPTETSCHLMIELSGDGDKRDILHAFDAAMGDKVAEIFAELTAFDGQEPLLPFLNRNEIVVATDLGNLSGLVFAGTPGHSIKRILAEEKLVEEIAPRVRSSMRNGIGAADILDDVRRHLRNRSDFAWAMAPAPSNLEKPADGTWIKAVMRGLLNWRRTAPILGALLAVFTAITYSRLFQFGDLSLSFDTFARIWGSLIIAFFGTVLFVVIILGLALWRLHYVEKKDTMSFEDSSNLELLRDIQEREDQDGYALNHMTAVSTMKPGIFRVATLSIAFYVIAIFAKYAFRPGHLATINSIHFARWVRIKSAGKLVFLSNYGGSWESYLEDFVTKASEGLTGIWSNTFGFPKAKLLFLDGSRDGDRFKRWARKQQVPTSFWYAAYPTINTTRIRKNSRIRQGIAEDRLSDARDWLSLFTSIPRQVAIKETLPKKLLKAVEDPRLESLETGEIQSIIFGPLGHLDHARMFAFQILPQATLEDRIAWLDYLLEKTSFGDSAPTDHAVFTVLGPTGLIKLGLPGNRNQNPLASFPLAFRQGMDDIYRSRILDDRVESNPSKWCWGSKHETADIALTCYASTDHGLARLVEEVESRATKCRVRTIIDLPLTTNRLDPSGNPLHDPDTPDAKPLAREHFGFVDGVSQPVIKGTRRRRSHNASPMNILAPGEFLFGYRDEYGYYPPSPTVSAEFDPHGRLKAVGPNGEATDGSGFHDFGRNGSFVVIRQLEQHIKTFNDYCESEAARLAKLHHDPSITDDWVGARIVGRWKNGSSLTRNPEKPGKTIDNSFTYGSEDAQGLHCPLGAHIRRSNPRDSLGADIDTQLRISRRHRILRAGRSYDLPANCDGNPEKGLLFVCFNASIERQYEFIQQTWMSAQNFHGLRGEKDPLIGHQLGTKECPLGHMTVPRWDGSRELDSVPTFVTTRGGGYFFLPSLSALRYLRHRLPDQSVGEIEALAGRLRVSQSGSTPRHEELKHPAKAL